MRLSDRIQALINWVTTELAFLPPLVARVAVGYAFMKNGWGKLHNLGDITDFFASLHVPAPALNAAVASSIEFFGGILLIVGLLTRVASLLLISVMAVAILTAHILHPEVLQMNAISGLADLGNLVEFTFLVIFLWLAVAGPGKVSVDHFLYKTLLGRGAEKATTPRTT